MAENSNTQGDSSQVPFEKVCVIVAVDGSEFSDYAVKFYAEEMHRPDNCVILAHAVDPRKHAVPDTSQADHKAEEKLTDALVDKLTEDLAKLKLTAQVETILGDPGHAIVKLAQEKNASFIVIGSRGKGTIRRTLTGSVTDFVVHHSPVPVLVARHKDHEHTHPHHFHLNPFHKEKGHKDDHKEDAKKK